MHLNEKDYISVGRIVRSYGTAGWIGVEVYSGLPNRFSDVSLVYFRKDFGIVGKIIENVKIQADKIFLKLKNINTREEARELIGEELLLPDDELIELEEDTYFIHDLIGLSVFDEEGNTVGQLTEVLSMGANDVYVIKNDQQEVLVPAVGEFVKSVDLEQNRMVVHLWEEI